MSTATWKQVGNLLIRTRDLTAAASICPLVSLPRHILHHSKELTRGHLEALVVEDQRRHDLPLQLGAVERQRTQHHHHRRNLAAALVPGAIGVKRSWSRIILQIIFDLFSTAKDQDIAILDHIFSQSSLTSMPGAAGGVAEAFEAGVLRWPRQSISSFCSLLQISNVLHN